MTIGNIVFPSFSSDTFSSLEIRQLVSALELRFQALESDSEDMFDTDTGFELDSRYSQIGHGHTESEISDLQNYLINISGESIFDLSDVSGSANLDDTLVWNGSAFIPQPASAISVALDDLTDVSVPAPTDGQVLSYVTGNLRWEATDIAAAAATSFVALTDTDLSGQARYDLVFNADGSEWQDTGGDLQWNPNLDHLQLAKAHSINWLDTAFASQELLVFDDVGVAGVALDYYLHETFVDSTETGTAYVDTTNGLNQSQAGMINGDTYLIVSRATMFNDNSAAAHLNGFQIVVDGTPLASSQQLYEHLGANAPSAPGMPYGYVGFFTANTAGTNVLSQHKRGSGGTTHHVTSETHFILNLTTDVPNALTDSSLVWTQIDFATWQTSDTAVTLGAGDWLIFMGAQVDGFSGAETPGVGINDGTNDIMLAGRVVEDSANDKFSFAGAYYLDGYAGGTVTVIGQNFTGTGNSRMEYKAICAIPLSDFAEAYGSQNTSGTEQNLTTEDVEEIIDTNAIASIANTGTNFVAVGFATNEWTGTTASTGFELQENVNSGGDVTVGWDVGSQNRKTTNPNSWEGNTHFSSARSYTAGDAVDIKINALNNSAGFATAGHRYQGSVLLSLESASTLNETFIVGDPLLNTQIDGAQINATADTHLQTGSSLTIWDATDTDNAAFSHDGTDFNTDLVNTTNWNIAFGAPFGGINITGLTVGVQLRGQGAASGGSFGIFSPSDTYGTVDWWNGTTFEHWQTAATNYQFAGTAGNFWLRDGLTLRISDALDTDWAEFSHDGTDFNTDFTTTTDWNINDVVVKPNRTLTDGSASAEDTLRVDLTLDGTVSQSGIMQAISAVARTDNSGTTSDVRAINASASDFTAASSGNTGNLYGIRSESVAANSVTGNQINSAYGIWSKVRTANAVGRISAAYGVRAGIDSLTGGQITTGYAIYAGTPATAGTFINAYGLYIEDQTGASTLNYAIYSAGGQSYHADNFGIGDLTPSEKLSVWGSVGIWDAGGTDNAIFSHDGTDFNTAFTTTTDWNITGLTGDFIVNRGGDLPSVIKIGEDTTHAGTNQEGRLELYGSSGTLVYGAGWSVTGAQINLDPNLTANAVGFLSLGGADLHMVTGTDIRLWDGTNTNRSTLFTGGTDTSITSSNIVNFDFTGYSGGVRIRDGAYLRIQDTGDTDTATFSHDGTDFNTVFTLTADWLVTGLAGGEVNIDGSLTVQEDLTVSGTLTSINTSDLNIADNLIVLNSDEVGAPSLDAGVEIERGTSLNVSLLWDETLDKWTLTNDGTTWREIMTSGASLFGDLLDVDLTGAADNDMLYRVGGNWIDTAGGLKWTGKSLDLVALNAEVSMEKSILQSEEIGLRLIDETSFTRWTAYMDASEDFTISRYGATGLIVDAPFSIALATGDISILHDTTIHGGSSLFMVDSSGNDSVEFSHDGTNFNIDPTLTTDINFNAGADVVFFDNVDLNASVSVIGTDITFWSPDLSKVSTFLMGDDGVFDFFDISGVTDFYFEANIVARTGSAVTIFDGTNADSAVFSHDGVDFNTAFTTTADWDITGITNFNLLSGTRLAVFGPTNVGQLNISHNDTDLNITNTTTTDWNMIGLTGNFWLRDGAGLKISDAGDTDFAVFSHDGADFNTVFTLTADWNISGIAAIQGTFDLVQLTGEIIRQFGPGTTGIATHSHDATDYNSVFSATTDWNITGLTGRILQDAETLAYLSEIPTGTPINGTVSDSTLRWSGSAWTESTIAKIGDPLSVALTGTVTVTIGTAAVVGIGTLFTTQLSIGDAIEISGEIFSVLTITDALNLTLDSNHAAGAAGVVANGDPDLFSVETGDSIQRLLMNKSGEMRILDSAANTFIQMDNGVTVAGWAGLWAQQVTPSVSNYAMLIDGTNTILGTPTGGTLGFRVNNSNVFSMDATDIKVRAGKIFSILDSTEADNVSFQHDGLDLNQVFTGTADWNVTGANMVLGAGEYIQFANDFPSEKLVLFGTPAASNWSIGVESDAMFFKSITEYQWYINVATPDLGVSASMELTSTLLDIKGLTYAGDAIQVDGVISNLEGSADKIIGYFGVTGPQTQVELGAYNWFAAAYQPLEVHASTISLQLNAGTVMLDIPAGANSVNMTGTATASLGVSASAPITDVGQVGQLSFMDVSGGVSRFGGFNFDTAAWMSTKMEGLTVEIDANAGVLNLNGSTGIRLNADTTVRAGSSLFINDGTDIDSMELSHDGLDLNSDFTTTTDWNLNDGIRLKLWDVAGTDYFYLTETGGQAQLVAGANGIHFYPNFDAVAVQTAFLTSDTFGVDATVQVTGGHAVGIWDTTDADWMQFQHNGTHATLTTGGVGGGDFHVIPAGGNFDLRSGTTLVVRDTGNLDFLQVSLDGTDCIFNLSGLADVNFTGATGYYTFDEDIYNTGGAFQAAGSAKSTGVNEPVIFMDISGGLGRLGTFNWSTVQWVGTGIVGNPLTLNSVAGTLAFQQASTELMTMSATQLTTELEVVIEDSGNTDSLAMSHDGVDFAFTFTGTGEAAWTGADLQMTDNIIARAELLDYGVTDQGNLTVTTSAATFDLTLGNSAGVDLQDSAGTLVLTVSNPPASGTYGEIVFVVTQGSTARLITWPTSFDWPAGAAPTLSTADNAVDVITAFTIDGGTRWYATFAQAFA